MRTPEGQSVVKWHEVPVTLATAGSVRKMIAKKACKYVNIDRFSICFSCLHQVLRKRRQRIDRTMKRKKKMIEMTEDPSVKPNFTQPQLHFKHQKRAAHD